jgi:hypothetical protein
MSQNFGKLSTSYKFIEQQIFISFSQSIYIKEYMFYLLNNLNEYIRSIFEYHLFIQL